MSKGIPNINRLACWPELQAAGFVLESFRDECNKVNCIGAALPSGFILVYRNEEQDNKKPWVLSVAAPDSDGVLETHTGRTLVDRIRELKPDLFAGRTYSRADMVAAFLAGARLESVCSACGGEDFQYVNSGDAVVWLDSY